MTFNNEQWIEASRPGASSNKAKEYQNQNRMGSINQARFHSWFGDNFVWNPYGGEETYRVSEGDTLKVGYTGGYSQSNSNRGTAMIQGASLFGTSFTLGGSFQAGNGYWRGANGKYYNTSWGGNQFTGSRNAVRWSSRLLKGAGTAFAIPALANIGVDWMNNNISTRSAISEGSSSAIGAFGGVPGIGWTIGWESGRLLTSLPWYRKNIRPFLQDAFGIPRDEFFLKSTPD